MIKRIRVYFHRNKEANSELIGALGIDPKSGAASTILFLGYELEAYFEIDTRTGEGKLIGADGTFLGEESYRSEKCGG